MKLFHPSNVYEESWLLLITIKILGLYPVKFFKITFINYTYVFVLIIIYATLYLHMHYYAHKMFLTFLAINHTFVVRIIQYYINILLFPTIIISSVRQSSKIREIFEQINSVDKNVKFFNTKINHKLCMKNDIVVIITTMFIVIMTNLTDYYGLLDNDKDYIYVLTWMCDRIPEFFCVVVMCTFTVFIDKIKFRLRKINTILNGITKGKSFISISEMSDVNNAFRCRLLKSLQFELTKTISLINEAYGFRFKVLTILYTIYIFLYMCVIYVCSGNQLYIPDLILTCICGTIDLIKLVYLLHLYRSLTLEYTLNNYDG